MASKYDGLGVHLRGVFGSEVPMTFAEIERVTGVKLPPKAQHHRAWWSNNPSNNVMTKVWIDAGFETAQVDMAGRKLVFKRIAGEARGMAEEPHGLKPAQAAEKGPRRHPAFGALKGTFTIDPGWDLTKPSLDPDELAEIEANIQRTADLIEAGLTRKSR
jgi:hypothetical protein